MTEEPTREDRSQDSRKEQTQNFVDRLADQFGAADSHAAGHAIAADLAAYKSWLDEAHAYFRDASRQELTLTYASEWVLDNYYIIRQALRQIDEDLPPGYYAQLPKLTAGPLTGYPRIYAITREVLVHQNLLINMGDLQAMLVQLQERVPLTMGELWAVPIFLRYGLIESLAHTLERILAKELHPKGLPHLPPASPNKDGQPGGQPNESGAVANVILSLRAISEQDWNAFFDSTSRVEQTLRQDPVGVYPQMDFKSRDRYRKAIEHLAFATGRLENDLAEISLEMAREGQRVDGKEGPQADRRAHVGYYLLAGGREAFEVRIGYHPHGWAAFSRLVSRHASAWYLGGIFILTALLLVIFLLPVLVLAVGGWAVVLFGVLLLIPALTIATSLVNWLLTIRLTPRILPKMLFQEAIPAPFRTLVTVPALITGPEEVDSLLRQIEMHFLRNPEPGLLYALLTDFGDAGQETLPEDAALVQRAVDGVNVLNARYASENGTPPFFLLHRPRVWNPGESKWMGWERKRGKLHALNQLLLGKGPDSHFSQLVGDLDLLKDIRFVITLDADTVLPRGAARRLVGALAHPLNRALFDEKTGRVVSGYTVLQPRMEISPTSADRSWFTRIFAGDAGLDLYTLAVSDAYQDLFGEGIYVGKGIYDVAAFERSAHAHIPENRVLSHDLLEGLMGRAGLVTDITMVEDYPPNYFAQAKRQRRWIRGDWQLLPWLLHPARFGVRFSAIDRWKIIDNLRRSLLSPALFALFAAGMLALPSLAWLWTAVLLLTFGVPLLTGLARGVRQTLNGETLTGAFHSAGPEVLRWILAVAFLPYEAYEAADAILITLVRLLITHRNLLQWTTAAQVAQMLGMSEQPSMAWEKMGAASLVALVLGGLIGWLHPAALWAAAPVLLLWLVSPLIARWINQPVPQVKTDLTPEQVVLLRRVTRRTWSFFERFVGPEDHWLPPDHFQESPVGMVAHRTSPTNIGLLLNSTLAAYDMGYLDSLGLSTRLIATMDTLGQLERYRGHFINWYDTITLQPLRPRYVSTVDSGNLAASLIVTAQACKSMAGEHVFRWALWQGYLDALSMLHETLAQLHQSAGKRNAVSPTSQFSAEREATRPVEVVRQLTSIEEKIEAVSTQIREAQHAPERWHGLFETVSGPFWKETAAQLASILVSARALLDLESLRGLQEVAGQVARHHLAVQRTINELSPWIPLMEAPPALLQSEQFQAQMKALTGILDDSPRLGEIAGMAEAAREQIAGLRAMLQDGSARPEDIAVTGAVRETQTQAGSAAVDTAVSTAVAAEAGGQTGALAWLDRLEQALAHSTATAGALLNGYTRVAADAEQFVRDMDFTFLYNPLRHIFHIGYNLDAGQLDNNYYDLLASEARIASLIAIARGEAPPSHWLHMGRPVTEVEGRRVLLSWSATMFEYLMPPLFLPTYPGTLLAESAYGAVQHQIAYGKSKGVPWGISESGFYRFDNNQSYQYRAFGVPGLGYKRGLGDDLVIAPYASLMAVRYDPHAVVQNIGALTQRQSMGLWGFYEAIDFTADRLLLGEAYAVVKEYMAHHQGMVMLAMNNFFNDDIMVRRMMGDPRIQSVDLLLQEQVPLAAPAQSPYTEDVKGVQRMAPAPAETVQPWTVPVQTPIPQVALLSNGSYSVMISNAGGGYSSWQDTDLTRWQPDGVLDPWGTWVYIQDRNAPENSALWSAGFQPVPGDPNETHVTFFPHMAVIRRRQQGIVSTMEVAVAPDDPVEIRRVTLSNDGDRPRSLRLTSYGEVVLNQQAADSRHPAFNKLFIESEWLPDLNLQIFKRRLRSEKEKPIYMGHMLLVGDDMPPTLAHEADRARFIGRGGDLRCRG